LLIISILFGIIFLKFTVDRMVRQEAWQKGFLVLIGGLTLVRGLMIYFDFPYALIPLEFFDPHLYASSDLNHSLGDLLLNELALLVVVVYLFRYYRRFPLYQRLTELTEELKIGLVSLLLLISFLSLYFQYLVITLFYHSQWSLDVVTIVDFSFLKLASLIVIVLNAVIYFLASHLVMREAVLFTGAKRNKLILCFLIAATLFTLFSVLSGSNYWLILIVHSAYLGLMYFLRFPAYFGRFNYVSFLYLFVAAISCAVVGAYAINNFEKTKNINAKQRFADRLLNERDIQGEWLLSQAAWKIQEDAFISNQILFNPLGPKDKIIQKINHIHLDKHLDQYDIKINLFDSRGAPYVGNEEVFSYQELQGRLQTKRYETEYENLYFINEIKSDLLKRYLSFIPLKKNELDLGYVIIDLKLKRVIPNTVYPELLVYGESVTAADRNYSYAIFAGQSLVNNSGEFNYDKDFKTSYFNRDVLYELGLTKDGFHHLAVDGPRDKVAIISTSAYPWRNVLANFSFLFILFIFCIITIIVVYTFIIREQKVKLNYTSRIQLYLNLAFFVPLLIVSATTLSLISSSSKEEVVKQYFEKAESISNNIVGTLDSFIKKTVSQEVLVQTLTQLAQYSESDINIFDVSGQLIATSQPKIYEYALLSKYINPEAFAEIHSTFGGSVLLNESVGSLPYKSAYVGIKSFDDGSLLGVLSIPFFESKYEENKQVVIILTNILNIFTFIFIIILVISYFASQVLTVPLKMITQKIKKTTLTKHNEPLEWNSQDEIGIMVGEYNRMLKNLENSKKALAQSEKESAWREMAKQVAHEIKNPLTPMKLTLQHLKRTISDKESLDSQAASKPINTLLEQIDTLSDIATSFSSFAQMPIPKHERFELAGVLRKTIQLYKSNNNQTIRSSIETGTFPVIGDGQLMGRIFSNLIINGIQSVPASRKAEIDVFLERIDDQVLVRIKDNGNGIEDNIAEKVFIPNFSTKETGSGIGLSIAKRGVEHAGGSIWFETECGVGTTIFVELPLTE
ncbi:MAG: ATP-binding protein, partial [Cyclobacteriaceae bacterium]